MTEILINPSDMKLHHGSVVFALTQSVDDLKQISDAELDFKQVYESTIKTATLLQEHMIRKRRRQDSDAQDLDDALRMSALQTRTKKGKPRGGGEKASRGAEQGSGGPHGLLQFRGVGNAAAMSQEGVLSQGRDTAVGAQSMLLHEHHGDYDELESLDSSHDSSDDELRHNDP